MYVRNRMMSVLFYMGYGFLYLPIILVVLYSFNKSSGTEWGGFSLKWYHSLLQYKGIQESLWTSVKIAFVSATFSLILGTMCASGWMNRHNTLSFLSTLPLVIPEVVIGLSFLLFFFGMQASLGWPPRGMWTIISAHTLLGSAYVTTIVRTRMVHMDSLLREAALDLGARPYKVFFLITFPILAPVLFASWLIAFILSFDDVILASFTSGPGTTTLPLLIFSSLKVGYSPRINALATCIIVAVSLLIMIAGIFYQRKKMEIHCDT